VDTRRASKTCPDGQFFDVSAGDVVDRRQASKPCPSGHFFDVWRMGRGGQTQSIENVPRWARFRCSGWLTNAEHLKQCPSRHGFDVRGVGRWWTYRASKTCPDGHGFDVWDGGHWQSTENVPIWAFFRCSAGEEGWTHTEHRKNAQMGVVSMFGKWWRRMGVGGGQTAPLRRVSNEGGGTGWLEGMTPPPSRVSSEGGVWGWLEANDPPSVSRFEQARGIRGGWKEGNPLRLA